MNYHPVPISRVVVHLASIIGVLIGLMFAFVVAIVFQTSYPDKAPLEFEEGKAAAFVDADDTVVVYLRPFVATRTETVALERSVICRLHGGEAVFDLPQYLRTYQAHERIQQQRVILYPAALPVGTKCIITTDVKWSPVFSMNWHIHKLPPLPFEVVERSAIQHLGIS